MSRVNVLIAAALAVSIAGPVLAQGKRIQNRIGLRSAAVIRNDLRQRGIQVSQIQLKGNRANVTTRVGGKSVKLEYDRLLGGARIAPGATGLTPALRRQLQAKLPRGLIGPRVQPGLKVKQPLKVTPRLKTTPR